MAVTMPAERKRCPLCLAILEMRAVGESGQVATVKLDGHTPVTCEASTLSRIKVLEEMHQRDARDLEHQAGVIAQLGAMIGSLSGVVTIGRRWLALRAQRVADIARIRGAFGTADRASQHPLWEAEADLATAVNVVIEAVGLNG
jgi:hypothetical protein